MTNALRNGHAILHLNRTTTKTPRFLAFPSTSRFADGMYHSSKQSSAVWQVGRNHQRLFRFRGVLNTISQADQASNNPVDLARILSCPTGMFPVGETTASWTHYIINYIERSRSDGPVS
jgi:hypothetical protein